MARSCTRFARTFGRVQSPPCTSYHREGAGRSGDGKPTWLRLPSNHPRSGRTTGFPARAGKSSQLIRDETPFSTGIYVSYP